VDLDDMRFVGGGGQSPPPRTLGSVFERFTEGARQAVVLAQDEARLLRHNYIGTEHLLLGLLREQRWLAARVLGSFDITLEEVRAQVERVIGRGDELAATGQIPFTPRAKKVLELALREARSLDHNYIGTEHILLGIVRENDGVAARILLEFDADAGKIRNAVVRMLSSPQSGYSPDVPQPEVPVEPDVPDSSLFAPQVYEELKRVRDKKESAIEDADFFRAAALRDRERSLSKAINRFEQAWQAPAEAEELDLDELEDTRGSVMLEVHGAPRGYPPFDYRRYFFMLGAALFGVASGIGLFVGWLIWG
jgi:hypothetical protein